MTSQPLGSPRRVLRPGLHGGEQRLLDGVLGRREIGSATDEDTQDSGSELPQQLVVGLLAHSVTVGGSVRNGRTSSHS